MTNRQGRTYQNQKEEINLYNDGQYIMKQARSSKI